MIEPEDNCACGGGDLSGHDVLCPENQEGIIMHEAEPRGPHYPEIVGPFLPEHRVTINGYSVPYITVTPTADGRIDLLVDRRFGLDAPVPVAEFNRWIGLLADAMAVAAGYSSHGEHCTPLNPHKARMT